MRKQSIQFRFSAKKAGQAASKLLRLSGGRRNYMELIKLLYLADRDALICLQRPITGDQFCALRWGPVLSHVLDLIKWGPVNEEDAPWFDLVSPPQDYEVKALEDLDDDELSELSGAECKILDDTFAKYGTKGWRELSRLTHELPEWHDPGDSSSPISFERILELERKSPEEINHIKKESLVYMQLDGELANYQGENR